MKLSVALVVAATCVAGVSAHAQPSVPEVHGRIREIEAALIRGQVDPIRIELQNQARNRPGDVTLRVYLAWCEMPSDESWNALKGIASIYPDNPWARLGMGRIYLKWKMRDQALTELSLALKSHPSFYPAHVGLGDVARAAEQWEEAEAHYRKALELRDDPEAHGGLGLVLLAKGDRAGAKRSLTRAIELWSDQPRLLAELSKIARDEKDAASALRWAEKLADLQPRDPLARRTVADLRFDTGDKAGAAKDYERAIRLGVVDVAVYKRVATLHRELGDAENEQRAVEQLSALERNIADHPARLAQLAEARSDLEAAEAQLLEAIDRTPTRADLHAHLARIRIKRDNPREALDAYRAALAAPEHKVEGLDAEAASLADKFKLPKNAAKGTVDQIYWRVSANLDGFYKERLKQKPNLGGMIKVRVRVDEAGVVKGADVIEDTVGEPYLVGHAYFALKDATFPKQKREPVFEFELRPPKGKK